MPGRGAPHTANRSGYGGASRGARGGVGLCRGEALVLTGGTGHAAVTARRGEAKHAVERRENAE